MPPFRAVVMKEAAMTHEHETATEAELREVIQQVKRERAAGLSLLYLSAPSRIEELPEQVGRLEWLTWLDLEGSRIANLSPLAPLVRLENLDLRGTGVADLSPLAGMADLRHLSAENTDVTDLSPLSGLVRLRELWLDGTAVEDLSPLAGCRSLRRLNLRGTRVRDLSPLADLPELEWLDITESRVEDLTPVLRFPRFLAEEGEAAISFDRIPAVARDRALERICDQVEDPEQRAEDLVDHLTRGTRLTDWRGTA